MDLRGEFIGLVGGGVPVAELCRRFGISRKTGYKWLGRSAAGSGLGDRSRRPHGSPMRTSPEMEARIVALRRENPAWGGRKLAALLAREGLSAPSPSTITEVLRRHGLLGAGDTASPGPFTRFEHERPNDLWQMDFKGHFALGAGRCHPLTVLDDHSRYALGLEACADERTGTVRGRLEALFARYGLPRRMLMDNGAPWGNGPGDPYTPLVVWLMLLGIKVSHGRPYHPQTQGKEERFHRTLKVELLQGRVWGGLDEAQAAFKRWRHKYNHERPHQALAMATPASRYQPSPRPLPQGPLLPDYGAGDAVRRVQQGGWISFQGRDIHLPKAFCGHQVAIRPTLTDGVWEIYFAAHRLSQVDLRQPVG